MSKVEVSQRPAAIIPPEYFSKIKPACTAFEQIIPVQPLVSAFSATSTPFKVSVEMPNVNFRLSEVYLECSLVPTISSTDAKDTIAAVQPILVKWGTSLINQIRFLAGSTEVMNQREVGLRYNWQQNVWGNDIRRLKEIYNNRDPVAFTSSTAQLFRFPLAALGNDFWALSDGIWPGSAVKKCILEVYWEVPAKVFTYAGTIVGTVTFGYNISGFNVQIVMLQDPMLDNLISTRGMILNYLDWFYYTTPISTAATQSIQLPVAFKSLRAVVFGIRRVGDITSQTLTTKYYLMSSEVTAFTSLSLRINSQRRQQDPFTGTDQVVAETKRVFPVALDSDYWNNLTTNSTTHSMAALLSGQCYCVSVTSGLDTQRVSSSCYLEYTLTSALSTSSQLDAFFLHDRAITTTKGSMYIDE